MLDFHLDSGGAMLWKVLTYTSRSEMNWTKFCIIRKKSKAEIEESFTIALLLDHTYDVESLTR